MDKEFYVALTKDGKVHSFTDLNRFLLRPDIMLLFKAGKPRKTEKNMFFTFKLINAFDAELVESEFELYGVKCEFNGGETWKIFKKSNIRGKTLSFTITDLVGVKRQLQFHNYPESHSAIEHLKQYVDDVKRLGTHEAIAEISELTERIDYLKERVEKMKKKLK